VGVFPNEEALRRLIGSILMDINEEWVTGRRYLTREKESHIPHVLRHK
jgi:putative transposase